jgi:hypothetical protein
VWAIVGPDLCYKFKRFEISRQGAEIDVTVIGEQEIGAPCLAALSLMRGVGFAINPPYMANEIILVFDKQGGGSLRQSVIMVP